MEEKKLENENLDTVSGGARPFDGEHCPNCGSVNFKMLGFIANHEIINYRCKSCDYYWEELA